MELFTNKKSQFLTQKKKTKFTTYLAQQQQRFLQFVLQNFGFNLFQGTAIDAEETTTALAVSNSGGGFLH